MTRCLLLLLGCALASASSPALAAECARSTTSQGVALAWPTGRIEYRVAPSAPVEGVVAVSANYWIGAEYPVTRPDGRMRRIGRGHLDWLRGREPVARAGSIWIFDTRRERTPGAL